MGQRYRVAILFAFLLVGLAAAKDTGGIKGNTIDKIEPEPGNDRNQVNLGKSTNEEVVAIKTEGNVEPQADEQGNESPVEAEHSSSTNDQKSPLTGEYQNHVDQAEGKGITEQEAEPTRDVIEEGVEAEEDEEEVTVLVQDDQEEERAETESEPPVNTEVSPTETDGNTDDVNEEVKVVDPEELVSLTKSEPNAVDFDQQIPRDDTEGELQEVIKELTIEETEEMQTYSTDEKSEEESTKPKTVKKPNVVIMIADDIGMGDLGIFGNTTMKTPHLDQMARDGAKLTQNIAAASVCTPSRAALLTGRYPIRSGMAPSNIVRVNIFTAATGGLPADEITLAELAKGQGYATGLVGKWHLGIHCGEKDFCHHPNKQGFDHFYGLPLTNLKDFGPDDATVTKSKVPNIDTYLVIGMVLGVLTAIIFRKTLGLILALFLIILSVGVPILTYLIYTNMTILNAVMMRNMDIVEQPLRLDNRLAARLASEATQFIDKHAKEEKPFLLVIGWVQAHTALHTSPEFTGVSAHGKYGDNVEEMDWSVGQILQALQQNNLDDNTLVYFTADNGAHTEEFGLDGSREGGYNGIYRGGKAMGGMEGGIRVPGIAKYKGKIAAGKVVNQAVSMMDMFNTAAGLIGATLPTDRQIDGVDILPLLKGDNDKPPHEFLFHYCGVSLQAARYSPDDGTGNVWKVHYATPNWNAGTENCQFICGCYGNSVNWHDPPLLYNLATDPSERTLLDATDTTHAPIVAKIKVAADAQQKGVKQVDDQMSPLKVIPYPPLQPCCGDGWFPSCDCAEPPFGD